MTRFKLSRALLPSLTALLLLGATACDTAPRGGGSSEGGSNASPPEDNVEAWVGTLQTSFALSELEIVFDGDQITRMLVNGTDNGVRAQVVSQMGNVQMLEFADGSSGGFVRMGRYAAFLSDAFDFGVVQQGASGLASSYSLSDLRGSYSGTSVWTDFNSVDETSVSLDIDDDGLFYAYVDNDVIYGQVDLDSSSYGRFIGNYQSDSWTGVQMFLSPDKSFIAAWSCPGDFPTGCHFTALSGASGSSNSDGPDSEG